MNNTHFYTNTEIHSDIHMLGSYLVAQMVKNLSANTGRQDLIPGME